MKEMRFKKLRLWAAYPFAVLYLVAAYFYGLDFRLGMWLVLAGLCIRFWAAGFIKKIRVLTTAGPYAFVRNPLYVGNFLIGLGFCLAVPAHFLSIIYGVLFFYFYAGTVKKEEILLSDLFGKEYLEYKQAVPAFIPRLTPFRSKWPASAFSLEQAHFNGELIRVLVTGIVLCLLCFFYGFFKEKVIGTHDTMYSAVLLAVHVALLAVTIAHRKKLIKSEQNQQKK
ncbi:MAG: isoprenylcysteine carboxylmethyltransferase family protein [Candidatus Omnitrophica bacterium]|nr:isoprenylcysteine carboxylmethyltransferase family protein [Candidatus Omnitrophota bacterium]